MAINKLIDTAGDFVIDAAGDTVLGIEAGRGALAELITHFAGTVVRPGRFLDMNFDSGPLRLWTGLGDYEFLGNTYTGAGLINISRIEESKDIRATGFEARLNGQDAALLALILTENFQYRTITLYKAAFNADGVTLIGSYIEFQGFIDSINFVDPGEGQPADIVLRAESIFRDLQNPRVRQYTDEDQKIDYPTDTGLTYVASIQTKPISIRPAT